MTAVDPIADAALFDVEAAAPVTLADRFTMPPFSILDRRGGDWLNRRRRWLSLGIESEVGRGEALTFGDTSEAAQSNEIIQRMMAIGGTSVFDPVVCELVYRWFSRPGASVLDPFCGGSVRGIVAGTLERDYVGPAPAVAARRRHQAARIVAVGRRVRLGVFVPAVRRPRAVLRRPRRHQHLGVARVCGRPRPSHCRRLQLPARRPIRLLGD
jgi:hypothetical protein